MAVQLVGVYYASRDSNGNFTQLPYDDIISIDLVKDSDVSASSSNIKFRNSINQFRTGFTQPFGKYVTNTNDIGFKEGDNIMVYAALIDSYRTLDTSDGSADLIFSGEIAEVVVRGENSFCPVEIKLVDKAYIMLNRIHTSAYINNMNKTAPLIVQDVVRNISDDIDSDLFSYDDSGNNVSNGRYAIDARLVSEGGFIEDTRINASAFPVISMSKVAKPAFEWIKDLSALDATNDFGTEDPDAPIQNRNMNFHIDEQNRFHWYYPKDIVSSTLNGNITSSDTTITLTSATNFATSGTVFIGSERIDYTGISTNDLTGCVRGANNTTAASHTSGDLVTSAIVITEGDTSSGHQITGFNLTKKTFDVVNLVFFTCGYDLKGNGISFYFFDKTTKSKTLKDTYKPYMDISNKLFAAETGSANLVQDNTQTDFTYQGNFYKANKAYNFKTSWGDTVTSDNDYNDSFRDECESRGTTKAQALCAKRGSPRWAGTIDLKFKRYTAGEVIEFTSTRAGLNKQPLRIKKVHYNLTKSGAFVTLDVEEDERKLGES